ncbi:MAG: hypothetical protein ABW080_16940 [Candidatus Thiodiazotropha sp.]
MNDRIEENKYQFGPGDIRKLSILFVLLVAIIARSCEYIAESFYWILAALVFLYALDVFYTVTVSQRTEADLKAFIFQTAVPLFSLSITGLIAIASETSGSSIVTMFGLSLAYTTYVVGNPIGHSSDNSKIQKEDKRDTHSK